MLWIVRYDDDIYLFKNKVIVEFDEDGSTLDFLDVNGNIIDSEFEFCSNRFQEVTGIALPNLKPRKFILTMK